MEVLIERTKVHVKIKVDKSPVCITFDMLLVALEQQQFPPKRGQEMWMGGSRNGFWDWSICQVALFYGVIYLTVAIWIGHHPGKGASEQLGQMGCELSGWIVILENEIIYVPTKHHQGERRKMPQG